MANLTFYNVAICLVVALGGFTYGFGFAVFVTSIGQPGFYLFFKLDPTSTYTANILGAVNALFAFGAACGAIAQGFVSDWLGRKNALAVAAVCALVGGALSTGAVAIGMLITVRLLQGFGLGMVICLVPLYITEVSPPRRRGLMTGLTTMSFGLGYTACAWISVGAYHATNITLQWRLPLALACFGPLTLLIGLPFIPETPRYYSWIGKNEEAWKVIKRLHHDPNDPTEAAAHAEFIQITKQVEFDKEQKAGFIQMFTKPSWRRRSLLVIFLLFASQSTGILGITNFLVLIFAALNMSGQMPLVMYAIFSTVGTTAVLVSILITDRVGRRTLFLIGFPSLAFCLLAEGLLQWKYLGSDSAAGNSACLFFIFLYIVFYQCVDAPSFVWSAEIFPTTIRAKGISLSLFAYFVGAITYTTPSALAFKNIGWHMYILYSGLCLVSWAIVYFFIPETKNLPVEEIGALFGDEVVVHLTADGHGIVEDLEGKLGLEVQHHEGYITGSGEKGIPAVMQRENVSV